MSDSSNPYAPPTARVEDMVAPGESQPIKLWSARGRLGRLRHIAWTMLGSLLLGLGVELAKFVLGDGSGLPLGIAANVAYVVFFALLTIQRCHDIDWTGWAALWAIIPLVGLMFWFIPGTPGPNRFGPPPPRNPRGMGLVAAIPLLLVVLGIAAAIAIPAYQSYVTKARAAQGR